MRKVLSTVKVKCPKVQIGTGTSPPRVTKHLPKVLMGTGTAPPRVAAHLQSRS